MSVVRRSLALIGRERRGRWIALVVLAVVASLLEMVGAGLVYVLLAALADPGAAVDLPVLGRLAASADVGDRSGLLTIAAAVALFFLLRALVQVVVTSAQHRVAYDAGARLAEELAAGYLRAPYEVHLRRNSAGSIRNVNAAAYEVVQRAFLPMIGVAASAIVAAGLLAVMTWVSPLATVLAVVVVGGAVGALLRLIQPRLKHLGEVTHWWNRANLRAITQALEGYRDIRLLGREERFVTSYADGVRRLAAAAQRRGTVGVLPRLVMETALVGFILLFLVTAVVGGADSEAVVSTLGVFAYAGLRLQPSLQGIVAGLNELRYATAVVEDVHVDLCAARSWAPAEQAPRRPLHREVRFEAVDFRYAGVERPALAGVDLSIRAGQRVGICGPTGGGKSTLVDLLIGLLEPTSGRIVVDGEDLAHDVRGWQRNLGVVSQAIFLIDDTLRRNIAFGLDDRDIDEAALAEAVRLAQLDDVVAQLPDGLDTVVGERGVRLSGGQRQRVAIARALYRDAEVLVLDEGTSALDNRTEAALLAALRELPGRRTTVTVAHRLSTVRDADVVVYVEDGRVAGVATYDELLATNAGFRALARSR